MSEWDRKFSRMVAETERHLASVKVSSPVVSDPAEAIFQFTTNFGTLWSSCCYGMISL